MKYAILALVAIPLLVFIGLVTNSASSDTAFLGAAFLVTGTCNVLTRKWIARKIMTSIESKRPTATWPWRVLGQDGIELLYFEIGFILAVAGIVLLIRALT